MIQAIRQLFKLLEPRQRRNWLRIQIFVVIMAFAELVGIAMIGPFMTFAIHRNSPGERGVLEALYRASGMVSPTNFMLAAGAIALIMLSLSAAFSIYTLGKLFIFGTAVGAELSERLYRHYMYRDWLFHASGRSSDLTHKIAQECNRATMQVLVPVMQMNAKLALVAVMFCAVLFYDPLIALAILGLFGVCYGCLYLTVRRRLVANGQTISEMARRRFNLMSNGFGGIKNVLVLGRQASFTGRFHDASYAFSRAQGESQALAQAPRYAIETVAYGCVILLTLYLLTLYSGDAQAVLPALSFYGLVAFKMMPALQTCYQSLSVVRSNISAVQTIQHDLARSVVSQAGSSQPIAHARSADQHKLQVRDTIRLNEIYFTYPGKHVPALTNINIEIPARHTIGLIGATGSGKSTVIDILLGLIQPDSGQLEVDSINIDERNRRSWQNNLGYVAQDIFLADTTIRENIAFGLAPEQIDEAAVSRAATAAHVLEFTDALPQGLDTLVGERGVQLSGGQRQRIGIARALYHDADVMILDEATSALDGETEKRVMEAIYELAGRKTLILIAHRLSTVKRCDRLFVIDQGTVRESGTYCELVNGSEDFRQMVASSH